ncbi:MAG TPA: hypothetical protein VF155_07735 [Candidatus Dormibacteraeota bacterium]
MKLPLGKKGVVALGAMAGGLAFWRVRARRRAREEREWEAEVAEAIEQGQAAGAPMSEGS